MNAETLTRAFDSFRAASQSLESQYVRLQERIVHLTEELARKNEQLNAALVQAEESKNYLKAVLFSLEEAIVAMDSRGVVTMVNRSAEDLFGPSTEIIGRPFVDLPFTVHREGSDLILSVNGRKLTVIISRSPVMDTGGMVMLIKDITRLRDLEMHHERNQRLIAMGEMAAKLVHEIRNPLCSMELYAGILAREADSSDHRTLAQGISAGVGTLNNIVSNMLYFARPQKVVQSFVRLDRIVEDVLTLFTPFIESRRVTLRTALRECVIRGDEELLKQALINIVINAVHAVDAGAVIAISLRHHDGSEIIEVRDNGAGIPADNMERIFDPFFSTKDKGTGLGLTIASKIMISHGGFIRVTSEQGRGSTFSLHLPAKGDGQ